MEEVSWLSYAPHHVLLSWAIRPCCVGSFNVGADRSHACYTAISEINWYQYI
jgi:hypothetical protein